jgi:hypothetical protein
LGKGYVTFLQSTTAAVSQPSVKGCFVENFSLFNKVAGIFLIFGFFQIKSVLDRKKFIVKIIIYNFENLRFEIKGANFDLKFLCAVKLVKMKTLKSKYCQKTVSFNLLFYFQESSEFHQKLEINMSFLRLWRKKSEKRLLCTIIMALR